MVGYIEIISLADRLSDDEEQEIKRAKVNFKLEDVSCFYILETEDSNFIYTNINGIEYPFVYEDYLYEAISSVFEPTQTSDIKA